MFGKLKDWRRAANRYDRCPKVFRSAIARAATAIFWFCVWNPIETSKLNGIEPNSHLSGVLTAIAQGREQSDINLLLP